MISHTPRLRLSLHGLAVEIDSRMPSVHQPLGDVLGDFRVDEFPAGFGVTCGQILPYRQSDVLKRVSPNAHRVAWADQLLELYEDGERFWLVDDRWGMAEINLLKGQWRSWILDEPRIDARRCVELAILWPMAQLLRGKGLHLVPAASVVRAGLGLLLLSPFSLEPELTALLHAGYKIIGQRWTALREEDGRVAMLHLPGRVERELPPRLRIAGSEPLCGWIDLMGEFPGGSALHAICSTIITVAPGRRPSAYLRQVGPTDASSALRSAWPIVELHPHRRRNQIASRLANTGNTFQLQLSRNPQDLLSILQTLQQPRRPRTRAKVTITSGLTPTTAGNLRLVLPDYPAILAG